MVLVIPNTVISVVAEITQSAIQISLRLFSGILKQKFSCLLMNKYFNGTAISTFLVLQSLRVFPVNFALNLNDSEFDSSLWYCHKFIDVLNSCRYSLLNRTSTSEH